MFFSNLSPSTDFFPTAQNMFWFLTPKINKFPPSSCSYCSRYPNQRATPWLSKLIILSFHSLQFFTFHSFFNLLQSGSCQPTETTGANVTISSWLNLRGFSAYFTSQDFNSVNIFSLKNSLPLTLLTLYPSFFDFQDTILFRFFCSSPHPLPTPHFWSLKCRRP